MSIIGNGHHSMPVTNVELKNKKKKLQIVFFLHTSFTHRYMSMLIHTTHPRGRKQDTTALNPMLTVKVHHCSYIEDIAKVKLAAITVANEVFLLLTHC
jgi:hypothetical protein